ncbi:MAG TPA: family 1 glycosylhydrolase [Candidatus Baltobacteraceae bacterium]
MEDGFRFGVATADHQCEAYDGRDDIRDVWERVRGLTPRGPATDFWNRYREDVDLAQGLGCRAFRLSLSWARLEPEPGSWDDAAFEHYRGVLQYVRAAGMATIVTLHHNTWPLHVQAAGDGAGMLDEGFPQRMGAYAAVVAQRLGDSIDYYVTLNEPNQLVYGYIKGFWMRAYAMPPGLPPLATSQEQMSAVLQLIPNLFRAHARARAAILVARPGSKVGANPLILGLPRWLQRLADRSATHLDSPQGALAQAGRLSQHRLIDSGIVDITIAQLTITQSRMGDVLFSEPYVIAHVAALHAASTPVPENLETFRGRVGVVSQTPVGAKAGGYFPAAAIVWFADTASAVDALHAGALDLVFDDDVILQQYAVGSFALAPLPGPDQPIAVATALGSRGLLNLVDLTIREMKDRHPGMPDAQNRKTVANIGNPSARPKRGVEEIDDSIQAVRRRGALRVGVHPGVEGLCTSDGTGGYRGTEPDLARLIAKRIFGTDVGRVRFVELTGDRRVRATRSLLRVFDGLRKSIALFTTLLGANWWNLGMAGKLPSFLCPPECVGTLDYVGLDYYWGVPSLRPSQLQRLAAASECRYANAPVWPQFLNAILLEAQRRFPGKPIVVIENGCVASADGFSRADYVAAHVKEVERALQKGSPIVAYVCWSITSNREWGLPFDANSDFGLYHIDLDTDPNLTRVATPASDGYAAIIAAAQSPGGGG